MKHAPFGLLTPDDASVCLFSCRVSSALCRSEIARGRKHGGDDPHVVYILARVHMQYEAKGGEQRVRALELFAHTIPKSPNRGKVVYCLEIALSIQVPNKRWWCSLPFSPRHKRELGERLHTQRMLTGLYPGFPHLPGPR
jgi:hypothetical protein